MRTTYLEMWRKLRAIRDNLYLTESLHDEQWIYSKISSIEALMDKLGHDIESVEPVDPLNDLF